MPKHRIAGYVKNMTISSLGLVLALAGGQAALAADAKAASAGGDGKPRTTYADMQTFPAGPDVVGSSTLTRYNTYVDATVSASGLGANAAYSWWWVIFNNPEFCVGGCGLDDLPVGATPVSNGDPRVNSSLLWGGGFVANGTGAAYVTSSLERNKPLGEVRFGPGLKRARNAEIHIVLRTHGPAVAGETADMISRFHGGCTDEEVTGGLCTQNANVQFAAHPAP
jgi:hypothetical protein